jgi:hypothetical protein
MLRKLNFTERTRIPRSGFMVALRREADGTLAFDASLTLGDNAFPGDARVYVEAYHRTSYMRFDFGTVDAIAAPAERRLTEIDSTSVRFRIRIVDAATRRILAVADDVRVSERAPGDAERAPLLPVQFSSTLDQQPWRVAFEADTPVLELNNRIEGIEKLATSDRTFFALVYPAAVREILTRILLVEQQSEVDDEESWMSHWLRWAAQFTTAPPPVVEDDDAPRWIDEVVGAFCSRHRVVDRLRAEEGE